MASPASPADTASVTAAVCAMRPDPGASQGPLVSIVVPVSVEPPNLTRLLDALRQHTHYRSIEVIVVDASGGDEIEQVTSLAWGFPVRFLRTDSGGSPSLFNRGAALAQGRYLLLLSGHVEPINRGWLGSMVGELHERSDRAAAGALLVNPQSTPDPETDHSSRPGLSVKQFGLVFERRRGRLTATNVSAGVDPLRLDLLVTKPVPAVRATCLLVATADYQRVGGLSEAYRGEDADWDLALRLQKLGGDIVVVGGAVLYDHETAPAAENEIRRRNINRKGDRQRFAETWAARLSRNLSLDGVRRTRRWSAPTKPTIGITPGTPGGHQGYQSAAIATGFERIGWTVQPLQVDRTGSVAEADVDVALFTRPVESIAALPPTTVIIMWVLDRPDRWPASVLANADLVFAGSRSLAEALAVDIGDVPPVAHPVFDVDAQEPPAHDPAFDADYCFVGDGARHAAPLLRYLDVTPAESFHIFGPRWSEEGRVVRYWRGELDETERRQAYAASKLVLGLGDRRRRSLDSRVLEAAMAGALPVTDDVDIAADMLGDLLPTFSDSHQLRGILDRFLGDDSSRAARVVEIQQEIAANHTGRKRATELLASVERELLKPKVALKISPLNREVMPHSGDTHFARSLSRALRKQGFRTAIHILPEWDLPENQDADIVIHLRGLHPYVPKTGNLNILWIISHPRDVTPAECERYDMVLCASDRFTEHLRSQVSVPVETMHQATDPAVFHYVAPDPEMHSDLLFVGNARLPVRRVPRWLMELGEPLAIYGTNWEGYAERRLVRGGFVANEELHRLYCSADIVVNDHWADMAEHGFVSNRILDVLACGAFIVSDHVDALAQMLGDVVPTFSSKEELAAVVDEFRDDPVARARHALAGMEIVRKHHTFDARASRLSELIHQLRPEMLLTVTGAVDTARQSAG